MSKIIRLKNHLDEDLLATVDGDDGMLNIWFPGTESGIWVSKDSLADLIKLIVPSKFSRELKQVEAWNQTPENELNQRG